MSTGMNQWLAQIYGTDGAEEIEKTAQAHLLQKLAAEQNLDISQFTPEELEQLVQELAAEGYDVGAMAQPQAQQPQMGLPNAQVPGQPGMNPMSSPAPFAPAAHPPQQQPQAPGGMNPQFMQQAPQQSSPEVMQKEAQAKFEEADLLGRVMAHAYTDELEKIASHRKTAGRFGAAKDAIKGAVNSASNRAGHAADRLGSKARQHKGAIGAGAAGAAVGFAGGRASKSKEASAFEKLAEEHAAEILSATGYDPNTGQDMYGQQMLQNSMNQQPQNQAQPQQPQMGQPGAFGQQQAGIEQPPVDTASQYSDALDERALQLLAENGYDVNEILARIQMSQTPAQA